MYKVAILDDNQIVLNSIEQTINWAHLGCTVCFTCQNGIDGYQLLAAHRPHIVISDIMMPGLTGLELKKVAETLLPHARFILITGYSCSDYARQAVRLNVFDYIAKPISNTELQKVVSEAIASIEKGCSAVGHVTNEHREDQIEQTLTQVQARAKNYSPLTQRALELISQQLMKDISLRDMAQALLISSSYLSTLFKKETGISFVSYVTRAKLAYAKRLLADPRNKVYEVANRMGYKDYGYFYQVFKKYYGYAPGESPKY